MGSAKIMGTHRHPFSMLHKDDEETPISKKENKGMIGSILYLTSSRPDIIFAVGMCARFQSSPKESHLTTVKRILRYLVGSNDMGLWYKKYQDIDLTTYSDADYTGDKVERKSTSGACQFLGKSLKSRSCKKQSTIALSTTEAEYVSVAQCCSQILWVKNQLQDYAMVHQNTRPL
ncbi:secreted RxLR effector protein 161-like [Cicer arietinum]|uniref:secreted RxLR effector protein 161-like n=1 Tax=Cicer arietinum TaxID=3827 RepID=UPI00032AA851